MSSNIKYFSASSNKLVSKHAVVKQLQRKRKAQPYVEHTVESLGYRLHVPDNMIVNPTTGRVIKKSKKNVEKVQAQVPEWMTRVKLEYSVKQERVKHEKLKSNQFDITKPYFLNRLDKFFRKSKGAIHITVQSMIYRGRTKLTSWNEYANFRDYWVKYLSDVDGYNRVAKSTQSKEMSTGYYKQFEILSAETAKGGCNKNAKSDEDTTTVRVSETFNIVLHNPYTQRNQCGYKCVLQILQKYYPSGTKFMSYKRVYEKLNYEKEQPVSTDQLVNIYNVMLEDMNARGIDPTKPILNLEYVLDVKDQHCLEAIDRDTDKIFLLEGHYYVYKEAIILEEKKVRKGNLCTANFDYETRPDDDYNYHVGSAPARKLRDTICHFGYEKYGQAHSSLEFKTIDFTINKEKSAARQFVDYLNVSKRCYRAGAHNASNFDTPLTLDVMTDEEFQKCEIFCKGLSYTKVIYRVSERIEHVFWDTRDHLSGSLDSLCENFQIKNAKLKNVIINGETISTTQLCFYKPELKFWEFMDLERTNPEFWKVYNEYCRMDVVALYELVKKYKECDSIREDLALITRPDGTTYTSEKICKGGHLSDKLTISSGAMNLLQLTINEVNKYDYKRMKTFFEVKGDLQDPIMKEKTARSCNYGGISHVEQEGEFKQVIDYDKKSQYAAAQMHCVIPVGTSKYYTGEELKALDDYNVFKYHGCYSLVNVKFKSGVHRLKAIPYIVEGMSYQWNSPNLHEKMNIDSQLLMYFHYKGYIESYEIVSALLSKHCIKGSDLSAHYINKIYRLKEMQDRYKESGDDRYNPSLREIYKACLTSPYGKMSEDKTKYSSLIQKSMYDLLQPEKQEGYTVVQVKGVDMYKKKTAAKINEYIMYSVSILSFSKIMLFEYMEQLENGLNDVLCIETDGYMVEYNKERAERYVNRLNNYKFLETGKVDLQVCEENPTLLLDCIKGYPTGFGDHMGALAVKSVSNPEFKAYVVMKKSYRYVEGKACKEASKEWIEYQETGKVPLTCELSLVDGKLYKVVSKMKGIPEFSIRDDGTKYRVVLEEHYRRLLNNETIDFRFKALKKMFIKEFGILAYEMVRKVKKTGWISRD